uniref:Uncharacterized protein n=1 Tax=Glycine max TaxID=3847 RepID=V9GZW7_SOYBN|nr:unknown [Glycine max]
MASSKEREENTN